MKHFKTYVAIAILSMALPLRAQDNGSWKAVSTTARAITGDLVLTGDRLMINFSSFTIAQIRALKPAEVAAAFNGAADTATDSGNLYRLNIPAQKVLLHKNTLCGAEDTAWMATIRQGKTLQVAFFSGAKMPEFTPDAIANTTTLCGTFLYSR